MTLLGLVGNLATSSIVLEIPDTVSEMISEVFEVIVLVTSEAIWRGFEEEAAAPESDLFDEEMMLETSEMVSAVSERAFETISEVFEATVLVTSEIIRSGFKGLINLEEPGSESVTSETMLEVSESVFVTISEVFEVMVLVISETVSVILEAIWSGFEEFILEASGSEFEMILEASESVSEGLILGAPESGFEEIISISSLFTSFGLFSVVSVEESSPTKPCFYLVQL